MPGEAYTWHRAGMVTPAPESAKPALGWTLLGWLGVAGHLAMGFWYAVSGLVAPTWAWIGLLILWLAFSALVWWTMRNRPGWTIAIPVLEAAIWFAVISAGEAYLGWTA